MTGRMLASALVVLAGRAESTEILAECWEHEEPVRAAIALMDDRQWDVALSATEDLDLDELNVDCHSHVRELRARILLQQNEREAAVEEYLAIFDRDPQWRPVNATPEGEVFVDAARSQWLQENPIGLRVTPRAVDMTVAPTGGIEIELSHDPRFTLSWRVKDKPPWIAVSRYGGRTEKGAAHTRILLDAEGVYGRPGVVELECKPWAEVQIPVFGFEGADDPVAGVEPADRPRETLTPFPGRSSGPPWWLRVLGGVAAAGGAGYIAYEILSDDNGTDPGDPTPPFELPEPPDPPDDEVRFGIRFR